MIIDINQQQKESLQFGQPLNLPFDLNQEPTRKEFANSMADYIRERIREQFIMHQMTDIFQEREYYEGVFQYISLPIKKES